MADDDIKKVEEVAENAAAEAKEELTETAETVREDAEKVVETVRDGAEDAAETVREDAAAVKHKVDAAVASAKKGKGEKPAKQRPPQPISKKKAKAARRAAAAEAAAAEAEAAKTPEQRKADEKAAKAAQKAANKAKRKTRLSKTALIVLVAIGCAAMVISVTSMACAGVVSQETGGADYKLTGGVAATVNGVNITEDTVTKQIMSVRESSYESDEDWAQYLVDNDLTPESYRENVINSYARQYLIEVAEKENGVSVSDEEVEDAWKDAYASYGSEETFINMLSMYGYDEDSYKDSLKSTLAQDKLQEIVAPDEDVTDDEVISYINENISTYNDARRSSHILVKVDSDATDEEKESAKNKAQECLDKIKSGEMSWDDAVSEYSDDSSKDSGDEGSKGDVGWDKLSSFVDAYQTALDGLNEGDMTDVVESDYGYHIIKCTGYFHVDDSVTSIDQVPEAMKTYVSNIIQTNNSGTAYNNWLNDYIDKADIKINDMPADVPYNVSLDGVTKTSTDDTAETTDEASAEGEATAEGSSNE